MNRQKPQYWLRLDLIRSDPRGYVFWIGPFEKRQTARLWLTDHEAQLQSDDLYISKKAYSMVDAVRSGMRDPRLPSYHHRAITTLSPREAETIPSIFETIKELYKANKHSKALRRPLTVEQAAERKTALANHAASRKRLKSAMGDPGHEEPRAETAFETQFISNTVADYKKRTEQDFSAGMHINVAWPATASIEQFSKVPGAQQIIKENLKREEAEHRAAAFKAFTKGDLAERREIAFKTFTKGDLVEQSTNGHTSEHMADEVHETVRHKTLAQIDKEIQELERVIEAREHMNAERQSRGGSILFLTELDVWLKALKAKRDELLQARRDPAEQSLLDLFVFVTPSRIAEYVAARDIYEATGILSRHTGAQIAVDNDATPQTTPQTTRYQCLYQQRRHYLTAIQIHLSEITSGVVV